MATDRLRSLDGLRGILAVYILLGHTMPFVPATSWLGWLARGASHGRAAVDVFFILSGMVIFRSLRRWQSERPGRTVAMAFLRARAARLLPVYLVALMAACAALSLGAPYAVLPALSQPEARDIVAAGWPPQAMTHLAVHLMMAQGLFPPALLPDAEFSILGPAWSLSTEWQFYLCLAAILVLRRPRPAPLVAGLLILSIAGRALELLPPEWQFGRAFLPQEAAYFALGVASDALARREAKSSGLFAVALIGCILSAVFDGGFAKIGAPLFWAVCLTSLWAQSAVGRLTRRLLCLPPLLWLGAVSYPLYLIHAPVQRALMLAAGNLASGDPWRFVWLWVPPAILLPILAAWLLHHLIELPGQNWAKVRGPAPITAGG
jgi:peptidoglycan/LPS O-acetylase OafA/YrhL